MSRAASAKLGAEARRRDAPAGPSDRARAHSHGPACAHDHAQGHGAHTHVPFVPRLGALIAGRGLRVARGGRSILDGVDIDIVPGEIVTLIGPNGAGKTTLVRVLLGLERPDTGEVTRRPDLRIGYAPQRFDRDAAVPMTAARFLTLGGPATQDRIDRVLAEVGAGGLAGRQISQLSGGELQRVILARALVRDPQLLVLDEPVRGVDFVGEAELYGLIGRIRSERGLGVLLVSHDLHVVMAQSDHVICLNRHVCCHGVPETVAQHPEYVRLFGAATAPAFAIYTHAHDHAHDLAGAPLPAQGDLFGEAGEQSAGAETPR